MRLTGLVQQGRLHDNSHDFCGVNMITNEKEFKHKRTKKRHNMSIKRCVFESLMSERRPFSHVQSPLTDSAH